jgi:hypothetical protein
MLQRQMNKEKEQLSIHGQITPASREHSQITSFFSRNNQFKYHQKILPYATKKLTSNANENQTMKATSM